VNDTTRLWTDLSPTSTATRWRGAATWVATWLIASVVLASLVNAIADAEGVNATWRDSWLPAMGFAATWVVVLIPMRALARRVPLDGSRALVRLPLALLARVILAIVATVTQLSLYFFGLSVVAPPVLSSVSWPESSGVFFIGRANLGFVIAAATMLLDALVHRARADQSRALREARTMSQLADARLAALSMELQPHFLFNTLNAISTLVHSDPDAADRMIARLSALLRRTLEAGRLPIASLDEEMELLDLYLDIQRLRFGARLSITVDVTADLRDARVPRLLLQPLVENALNHGLAPKTGPVALWLSASRDGGQLVLTVRDDGVGLDASWREGTGLSNTRSRLDQLYPSAFTLTLTRPNNGGTLVRITLPYAID
jgi:sensor histidine kinase YesM